MRRVLSLVGAAALVMVAGVASAEAQTMNFTALLSGANEVPGVVSGFGRDGDDLAEHRDQGRDLSD